jgi:hypothetical protein
MADDRYRTKRNEPYEKRSQSTHDTIPGYHRETQLLQVSHHTSTRLMSEQTPTHTLSIPYAYSVPPTTFTNPQIPHTPQQTH